jgi:hypothetical protein
MRLLLRWKCSLQSEDRAQKSNLLICLIGFGWPSPAALTGSCCFRRMPICGSENSRTQSCCCCCCLRVARLYNLAKAKGFILHFGAMHMRHSTCYHSMLFIHLFHFRSSVTPFLQFKIFFCPFSFSFAGQTISLLEWWRVLQFSLSLCSAFSFRPHSIHRRSIGQWWNGWMWS